MIVALTYLNTSHVTVNRSQQKKIKKQNIHLNTSHVTVNQIQEQEKNINMKFKYISCYC